MAGALGNLWGWSQSPIYQALDTHRNSLGQAFNGLIGATDFGSGAKGFSNGLLNGQQVDLTEIQRKAEAKKAQDSVNATLAYLQNKRPDLYSAVQSGGLDPASAWKLALTPDKTAEADPSSTAAGRAQLAKQYNLDPAAAQQYVLTGKLPGANDSSKYGNSPIYAHNAQGEYIAIQPGSDGSINNISDKLPAGFTIDPGALSSDRAAGQAYGTAQGGMQFNLPAVQQNLQTELANIQALKSDTQGIEETFGKVAGVYPQQWSPVLPGTKRADYATRLDQVKGQNFLQAFSSLKGAGAITDLEGQKAQAALARLDQNQSKEAYLQALDDLESVLSAGYQRMSAQAGAGSYQSGTTPAGQPNNIQSLLDKYK